jgi:sugar phosphate isomerase/epimerase
MPRPVTLFTGQWADLPFEEVCRKAAAFGYDGVEIACWGDHFDVVRAVSEPGYCEGRREILRRYGLQAHAISTHFVGQAVCDRIDARHKELVPPRVWGDGDPEGVRLRAAEEVATTAHAAKALGVSIVNGFTGSPIWHLAYGFPPAPASMIDAGFAEFAERWLPILDVFQAQGIRFALEVHPTEIAFDIVTGERALAALGAHPAFGFNYDPSHLAYQGVDYVAFIRRFGDRIFHCHMKDAYWSPVPTASGVFGGHLPFGDGRRYWDFRSVGRGRIDFESIIRALNDVGYEGALSVEWEDVGMDRDQSATESCAAVRRLDFSRPR